MKRPLLLAACVVGALAAVAGAKLDVEVKPPAGTPAAKKLLIVLANPDLDRRKNWEEIFAGEFSLQGVAAVPSYKVVPNLAEGRDAVKAKVVAEGFDSVLIARLVGIETKVKYKEKEKTLQPSYLGTDWYGGEWYTYYQTEVAGYVENKSRAKFKIDYWRLEGEKDRLVWSATSDSLDPGIKPETGLDIITTIRNALGKAGLI
jgi:hypothetical protein